MSSISSSPFQSNLSLMNGPFPDKQPAQKGKRQGKWDPKPLGEQPGLQEALNCISLRDELRARFMNGKPWRTKDALIVDNTNNIMRVTPLQLTQHYKDLIQHHVATRVALFFQQAVVCYNTPFHFEIADTEGQFFEAPTLKLVTPQKTTREIKYQAAHSSTIPGLKACLRSDIQSGIVPHYFSFLPGSHLENCDNSTVALPAWVNQMDTLIDGRSKQTNVLRSDTIDLINQVALAEINPIKATKKFLKAFEERLISRPKNSTTMNPEKREVISLYLEQVRNMKASASRSVGIQEPHPFFDSLLSVNVSGENAIDIPKIRKIVFVRKYEIIREAQFLESKIMQICEEGVGPKMELRHREKLCILYQVRNDPPMRKALEKLFCVSVPCMEQNPSLCASLDIQYQINRISLDKKLCSLRLHIRNFRKMEESFQAMLLRDFRTKLRHLKQRELSDKLTTLIAQKIIAEQAKATPDARKIRELELTATSPATISRLENSRIHIMKTFVTPEGQRRKPLSLHYAVLLSEALNIQLGHFFCSFFNRTD